MKDNVTKEQLEYFTQVKRLLEQSNITGDVDFDTVMFDRDCGRTVEESAELFEEEFFKDKTID